MHDPLPPRTQRTPHVTAGGVRHDAADMSVTAAGDVTLGTVQRLLADAGQWLALDGDPDALLGELASHDSTGPLRLGYGGWRDVLTGVQYADADGELVTAGGMTVKNVAGYDLVKFMVGSHGCFGTIVTLTLRTYRRPEAALAATLPASAADDLNPLLRSDAPPHWTLLAPGGLRVGWLGRGREMDVLGADAPCGVSGASTAHSEGGRDGAATPPRRRPAGHCASTSPRRGLKCWWINGRRTRRQAIPPSGSCG